MAGNGLAKSNDRATTIATLLEKNKDQIAAALPRQIRPERMIRVVTTTLRKTPALQRCTVPSLLGAIMQSAQLGLEVDNGLGHAYLVPYKTTATLIVGYKGLVELARRSGQISTIYAYEVYKGDGFSYALGLNPTIDHTPANNRSFRAEDITHVYAVARLKDGGVQFEVMERAEVEAIRARSRAGKSGPWLTDYAAMARKTVLRRLCKLLPMSIEGQRAIALDEEADANLPQSFDVDPTVFGAVDDENTIDAEGEVVDYDPEFGEVPPDQEPSDEELGI